VIQNFELIHKSPVKWIEDLLKDPSIGKHIHWYAERKYRSVDGQWMHFVDEPYTADDAWNDWVFPNILCHAFIYLCTFFFV
jgi:hypothetical protein